MKILFIHQKLGNFGGAEANILLTARELHLRGHALELLYQERTGKNEGQWLEIFSAAHSLAPKPINQFRNIVQRICPDLIYLHNISDLSILAELTGCQIPVVRMVHDHEMYCLRGYKYGVFSRKPCERAASFACVFPCLAPLARNRSGAFPLMWKSFFAKKKEIAMNRQFRHFIVYSDHSRQELVKNGFDPKRITVHVPLDCPTHLPVASYSERNLLVSAGQIIRGKGFDVLLRCLARVQSRFECVILGDGSHRPHCESLCRKLGLQNRIQFKGYVPRDELQRYYLDATAFLMSSIWPEPFGMVGPEAMRYGLPVIGFDAGGIGEWLLDGQNGFLVPWRDEARFAERVDELLTNKNLARLLGNQGRARVTRTYEVSAQVDTLEQLFLATAQVSEPVRQDPLNIREAVAVS